MDAAILLILLPAAVHNNKSLALDDVLVAERGRWHPAVAAHKAAGGHTFSYCFISAALLLMGALSLVCFNELNEPTSGGGA